MKSKDWKELIIDKCNEAVTMKHAFEVTIDILSEIMEQRDIVYSEYQKSGCKPVIIKTLDRGNKNPYKNPLLDIWVKLNDQALVYLRDLGITPKGLKQLDEMAIKTRPDEDALSKAIRELEN